MLRQIQGEAQAQEQSILAGRGQRCLDPLPGLPLVAGALFPFDYGQRLLAIRPAADVFAPQDKVHAAVQNAEQIPKFLNIGLDGRCRAQQQVAGAGGHLQHEVEQVVAVSLLGP